MISSRLAALAVVSMFAAAPLRAQELAFPVGLVSLTDAELDTMRGQALVEWRGIALDFSLQRSAIIDGRPLPDVGVIRSLVIQQQLDGRTIQIITTLDAVLSNARWFLDQRMDATVRDTVTSLH